jgi:hypothetical protein
VAAVLLPDEAQILLREILMRHVYAVMCGDAMHIIPGDSSVTSEDGELVVHGREDHKYGPEDWDLLVWGDSREDVLSQLGRIKPAPRLVN